MKPPRRHQRGLGLLVILALLGALALFGLSAFLDARQAQLQREAKTPPALALARDALQGRVLSEGGVLPLPDLGLGQAGATDSGNFPGDCLNCAVVGRLPWRTLGLGDLRDGAGECLWYAVAGRAKKDSFSGQNDQTFNWDSWEYDPSGILRLADASGNLLPERYAALVIAPGRALPSQDRSGTAPVCGGNHDARNYLDPWNAADAPGNRTNYFPGSTNHRVATSSADKEFHLTANDLNNDRILGIAADDKFFSDIVKVNLKAFMEGNTWGGHLSNPLTTISGPKGTDGLNCDLSPNGYFCRKWKDHFLFTELSPPANITIDGASVGPCQRVLIFGGKVASGQSRALADRNNPANYLEPPNAAAFAVPTTPNGSNFSGASKYDTANPSQDVISCIP